MPNEKDEDMTIQLGYSIDQKSEKKAENSFANMTSLIADMAIIGKVAGEALGKMWDGMQKAVQIGVEGFQNNVGAVALGFDNTEINKLRAALDSVGLAGQTDKMAGEIHLLAQAFQNPRFGAEGIEALESAFGRAGTDIPEDMKQSIRDALEDNDMMTAIKLLSQAINGMEAGEGAKFAQIAGLGSMAVMGGDLAFENFINTMNGFNRIYQSDVEGLGELSEATAILSASLKSIGEDIATLFVGPMQNLAEKVRIFAEAVDLGLPALQQFFIGIEAQALSMAERLFGAKENRNIVGGDVGLMNSMHDLIGSLTLSMWGNGKIMGETLAQKIATTFASHMGYEGMQYQIVQGLSRQDVKSAVDERGEFSIERLEDLANEMREEKGQTLINVFELDGQVMYEEVNSQSDLRYVESLRGGRRQ